MSVFMIILAIYEPLIADYMYSYSLHAMAIFESETNPA